MILYLKYIIRPKTVSKKHEYHIFQVMRNLCGINVTKFYCCFKIAVSVL